MTREERLNSYFDKIRHIEGMQKLIEWCLSKDYLTAPASHRFHSAYEGGLADHCMGVTDNILFISDKMNYQWSRPESPYIIGLFHDLCKVNFYKKVKKNVKNEETGKWENVDGYEIDNKSPLGHGRKSVILLQQLVRLTGEEIYCILYHMGPYSTDKDEQREYSSACELHPEILLVHLADHLAGIKETRISKGWNNSKYGFFNIEKKEEQ